MQASHFFLWVIDVLFNNIINKVLSDCSSFTVLFIHFVRFLFVSLVINKVRHLKQKSDCSMGIFCTSLFLTLYTHFTNDLIQNLNNCEVETVLLVEINQGKARQE